MDDHARLERLAEEERRSRGAAVPYGASELRDYAQVSRYEQGFLGGSEGNLFAQASTSRVTGLSMRQIIEKLIFHFGLPANLDDKEVMKRARSMLGEESPSNEDTATAA
jgi:hypothetical protein